MAKHLSRRQNLDRARPRAPAVSSSTRRRKSLPTVDTGNAITLLRSRWDDDQAHDTARVLAPVVNFIVSLGIGADGGGHSSVVNFPFSHLLRGLVESGWPVVNFIVSHHLLAKREEQRAAITAARSPSARLRPASRQRCSSAPGHRLSRYWNFAKYWRPVPTYPYPSNWVEVWVDPT